MYWSILSLFTIDFWLVSQHSKQSKNGNNGMNSLGLRKDKHQARFLNFITSHIKKTSSSIKNPTLSVVKVKQRKVTCRVFNSKIYVFPSSCLYLMNLCTRKYLNRTNHLWPSSQDFKTVLNCLHEVTLTNSEGDAVAIPPSTHSPKKCLF